METTFKYNVGDMVKKKGTRNQPYCVIRRTVETVDGEPRNFYTLQREDEYDEKTGEYMKHEFEESELTLMADKECFMDAVQKVSRIMASCGVNDIDAFKSMYHTQMHVRMEHDVITSRNYKKL